MKIYFKSRSKARSVSNNDNKVVDLKDNPSVNGSRWAVVIKTEKKVA